MVLTSKNISLPNADKKASDLEVGSSVYLNENGAAVEYLVVNQGIPSDSSLYDSSCDGLWLLRKDIYEKRVWNKTATNDYTASNTSNIHAYLNGDFLALFDADTKAAIQQVKIPYVYGNGDGDVISGGDGLDTRVFLLSGYEVGWTKSDYTLPKDGAKLAYFASGNDEEAKSLRIAYLDGKATSWWLRSPDTEDTEMPILVSSSGSYGGNYANTSQGIRPALILSANAVFDGETKLFKGVS